MYNWEQGHPREKDAAGSAWMVLPVIAGLTVGGSAIASAGSAALVGLKAVAVAAALHPVGAAALALGSGAVFVGGVVVGRRTART